MIDVYGYAIAGLTAIGMGVALNFCYIQNSGLEKEIELLEYKVSSKEQELSKVIIALDNQNKAIEELRIDYNASVRAYEKLKQTKPEVIEKILEVKSNDCETVADSINSLDSIFN
jgi:uncharacterized coiled-coil protein SlyX